MITNLKNILFFLKKSHEQKTIQILNLKEFENLYDNVETYEFTVKEMNKMEYNIKTSSVCLIGRSLFGILADIEDIELIIKEFIEALEKTLSSIEKIDTSNSDNKTLEFIPLEKNEDSQFIRKLQDILAFIESICSHHKTIRTPRKLIALQQQYINNFEKITLQINSSIQSIDVYNKKEFENIKDLLIEFNMIFSNFATIIRKVAFQFNYDHCD